MRLSISDGQNPTSGRQHPVQAKPRQQARVQLRASHQTDRAQPKNERERRRAEADGAAWRVWAEAAPAQVQAAAASSTMRVFILI